MTTVTQKTKVKNSRTKRSAYLVFLLVCTIFAITRSILSDYQQVFRLCEDWSNVVQMDGLIALASLLCFVCVISFWFCLRRRLHDLGYSGWWVFLVIAFGGICTAIVQTCVKENLFSTEVGFAANCSLLVVCLVIGLIPSQEEDNKYGAYIEEQENWLPCGSAKRISCVIISIVVIAYACLYFVAAFHVAELKEYASQHYKQNVNRSYLHN